MYDAIEGMKILDLTRLTPGGYTTKLLSELGAAVTKIEDTKDGDYMRIVGPMYDEYSVWFHALNVNKKSVCLDLKHPEGCRIFKQLVQHYDVLIESFRPEVMARLGLDHTTLAKINPRLVYCSLTGYGQSGPFKNQPGHDINYMAIAGALGLNGPRNGPPVPPGLQVADLGGATMAAVGILAAYIGAQRTGKGRYIDISMTDTVLSWLPLEMAEYFATGTAPERGQSYLNGGEACYAVYPTKDGRFVSIGNREKKFWVNFCQAAQHPDFENLHFSKRETDFDKVEAFFRSKTLQEIESLFDSVDTCITPVLKLDEVPDHPQIKAREMILEENKDAGLPPLLACPIKFSDKTNQRYQRAPRLGEHTREILKSIGFTDEGIEQAVRDGTIGIAQE